MSNWKFNPGHETCCKECRMTINSSVVFLVGETQPAGKRHVMVKKEFCKGCAICVKLCPKKVLGMDGRGKVYVKSPNSCGGCGTCEQHCPDFAVSLGVK